jgi:hypothetical protein
VQTLLAAGVQFERIVSLGHVSEDGKEKRVKQDKSESSRT